MKENHIIRIAALTGILIGELSIVLYARVPNNITLGILYALNWPSSRLILWIEEKMFPHHLGYTLLCAIPILYGYWILLGALVGVAVLRYRRH